MCGGGCACTQKIQKRKRETKANTFTETTVTVQNIHSETVRCSIYFHCWFCICCLFAFGHAAQHMGSWFPGQELNPCSPCPLHWKHSLNHWTIRKVTLFSLFYYSTIMVPQVGQETP